MGGVGRQGGEGGQGVREKKMPQPKCGSRKGMERSVTTRLRTCVQACSYTQIDLVAKSDVCVHPLRLDLGIPANNSTSCIPCMLDGCIAPFPRKAQRQHLGSSVHSLSAASVANISFDSYQDPSQTNQVGSA